ncbi:zinc finger protein ZAT9-like [Phalaenopsis equestris]|uniref:zinc finger protein ZAT9-like n=1 Tax=Phalaenopsis equestris TaxID=78828 RepID=UPI0009E1F768|nr:zinc finger protein ZAT9-like [Phalaenopsis equestris]
MESYQKQTKHRCKICRKIFSSGRSLGGHMRFHIHSLSSGAQEKEKLEESRDQEGLGFGYAFRKNLKQTFRLSDFVGEDLARSSKRCRECGKEFPSWKSLFGHMRCHSEKTSNSRSFEEEGSWVQEKNSHESFSKENESVPRRKCGSKQASPASMAGCEPEEQAGAIILMMLSRDIGSCSDKISEEDSGDDLKRRLILNSLVLEKKGAMALGGHRASHKRIRICCRESPSFDTEASIKNLGLAYQKSRIHECDFCGKTFLSGQALGGHKRSHLVSNIGSEVGGVGTKKFVVQQFSETLGLNLQKIEQFEGFWAEASTKH